MYRRLTQGDRYQIEALLQSGLSQRAIARQLGFSSSSIVREVQKVTGQYSPKRAEKQTRKRRQARYEKRYKIRGNIKRLIRRKLFQDQSPEQIVQRLQLKTKRKVISCKTIYRYVDRQKKLRDPLWRHLRILRRERKDRKVPQWRPAGGHLPVRKSILERPKIVERRTRIGDFERDTVLGKFNGAALLTIVDRTSRLVKIAKVEKKTSEQIHRATVKLLKNEIVHTITNDNGHEFFRQEKTEKALETEIYFSQPYRSWERGTNENTNGLLRQYFPREMPIEASRRELKRVENLLNNRPRKCLGYKTPLEVHRKLRRQVMR